MSDEPKQKFFHFPLPLLAAGKDWKEKMHLVIAWATINAGLHTEKKMGGEENVKRYLENKELPNDFVMDDWDHRAWILGKAVVGYWHISPVFCCELHFKACEFLLTWGKYPYVRVMQDVVVDTDEGRISFREFSVLCAVYAIIGDKPYAMINRDRVRAGALGYNSAKDMFRKDGKLSLDGHNLLSKREDRERPLTLDQCRYTLDKLHGRKFFSRLQPARCGRTVYYSRSLNHEQLAEAVLGRWKHRQAPSSEQRRAQELFRQRLAQMKEESSG